MKIEIKLANGSIRVIELPHNTTITSDQLAVLMGYARRPQSFGLVVE